jgi:hypothetical protein
VHTEESGQIRPWCSIDSGEIGLPGPASRGLFLIGGGSPVGPFWAHNWDCGCTGAKPSIPSILSALLRAGEDALAIQRRASCSTNMSPVMALLFEHACRLGAEGIVSKRVDGTYRSARAASGQGPQFRQHRRAAGADRDLESTILRQRALATTSAIWTVSSLGK